MHDAELVGSVQCARGLPEKVHRLVGAEALDALDASAQGLALEQLHDEIGLVPVRDAEVEDLNGVRCLELRHNLRLGGEAPILTAVPVLLLSCSDLWSCRNFTATRELRAT